MKRGVKRIKAQSRSLVWEDSGAPLGGQEGSEHALSHLSASIVRVKVAEGELGGLGRCRQWLLRLIPQRDFDRAISSL